MDKDVVVYIHNGVLVIKKNTFESVLMRWVKLEPIILGRKVMTNLDSILKSRDITLPRKIHLIKAMIFPVVMYGCESWTIRKLSAKELMLSSCGIGEDS